MTEASDTTEQIFLGRGFSIAPPDGWSQAGTITEEQLEKKLKSKVSWTPPGECRAKIHWQIAKISVNPEVLEFLKILVEQDLGDLDVTAIQPLQPSLIRIAPESISYVSIAQFDKSKAFLYLEYHDERTRYKGLVCYAPAKGGHEGEVQILAYEGLEPFFSRFEAPARESLKTLSEVFGTALPSEQPELPDDFPLSLNDDMTATVEALLSSSGSKRTTGERPLVDVEADEREGFLFTKPVVEQHFASGSPSVEVDYAPEGSVSLTNANRSIIPPSDWIQSTFQGAATSLMVPPQIISWSPPDTQNIVFHWHQKRISTEVESVHQVQQILADQVLGVARQEAVHEFSKYLFHRDDVCLNSMSVEQFEESNPLLSLQIDWTGMQGLFFVWFDDSNQEILNILAYEAEQDSFVDYYDDVLSSVATLSTKPAVPESIVKEQYKRPTRSQEIEIKLPPEVSPESTKVSQEMPQPPKVSQELKRPTKASLEMPKPTQVRRPTVPDGFLALTEPDDETVDPQDFVGQLISPDELIAAFPLDLDLDLDVPESTPQEASSSKPTMELSKSANKIKAGKLPLSAVEKEAILQALEASVDDESLAISYQLRPGQTITSIVEDARPELDRSSIVARVRQIYEFNREHQNPIKAWTLQAGVKVILPSDLFKKD